MKLNELQREVGAWATENFGSQPPSYALVGAIEETGELAEAYLNLYQNDGTEIQMQIRLMLELQVQVGKIAHSILKRTQGIREDDPDVGVDPQMEAIRMAQIIIEDLADHAASAHDGREVDLGETPSPSRELADAVADTNIYLADFSQRAGIDLDATVEATWNDIVSARYWNSDLGLRPPGSTDERWRIHLHRSRTPHRGIPRIPASATVG